MENYSVVNARVKPVVFGEKEAIKDQIGSILEEIKNNLGANDKLLDTIYIDSLKTLRHIDSYIERDIDAIVIAGSIHDPIMINDPLTVEPDSIINLGVPVIYWTYQGEATFWAYSRKSFFESRGGKVFVLKSPADLKMLVKKLAVKNYLKKSKIILFGKNDVLPWGAEYGAEKARSKLGIMIKNFGMQELLSCANSMTETAAKDVINNWKKKTLFKEIRIPEKNIIGAAKLYLAIKKYISKEYAQAFGVSCYGDLFGLSKNTPCLAGAMLKDEGIQSTCDSDFGTLITEMIMSGLFDEPAIMSNFYPIALKENIKKHFGRYLDEERMKQPEAKWKNLVRFVHSGHIAVVPPSMSRDKKLSLSDWNGTGEGCTVDGELENGSVVTLAEIGTDIETLILTKGVYLETSRYEGMAFCRSVGLVELNDVEKFIELGAREHWSLMYGDRIEHLKDFAQMIGLKPVVF